MVNKLDSETALAKIKVLVGRYFEMLGRDELEDKNYLTDCLLGDIDEVLDNTNIDMRKVIIEKLELDKI